MNNITHELLGRLTERQQSGPAEPGIDGFIPQLEAIAAKLSTHVTGRVLAEATRETQLARAEEADVEVDACFRHIESHLAVEANRRSGVNVQIARGLYNAACPDGIEHLDDRIVEQNIHCARTLAVLRAPENAEAIAAVKLPAAYIDALEAALKESDDLIAEVIAARGDKSTHVALGRDAEGAWVDLMVRLRRYVDSRAERSDAARIAEGKALLQPLLDAVHKLKADAAARATRRKKKSEASAAPKPTEPSAEPPAPQTK